jgi:signal transduction histidine kinase
MKQKLLLFLLILITLASFGGTLTITHTKIDQPFPGYLTFQNGVVGAFYVPGWVGQKERIRYHYISPSPQPSPAPSTALRTGRGEGETLRRSQINELEIFSLRDYLLIVLLPAISGLLFFLLGAGLCLYLPHESGSLALLFFHFLVGNFLILSPEFHLTYRFSYLHLAVFAFIPAAMIHFAFLFPEPQKSFERGRFFHVLPYLASALLLIPYCHFFLQAPSTWIKIEYGVVFYVIAIYLFWLTRLAKTLRRPQLEFNRIVARYLLSGQMIAFTLPLAAVVAIFVGGFSFPLNFAAPVIILFSLSLFVGVIFARFRQSQMQLVQAEKWATVGNLMAGLAHEINNPLNFIYSNLEPLRETLQFLKKDSHSQKVDVWNELDQLVEDMEEGATRVKSIVENFRYFSYPSQEKTEAVDLHEVLDQSLKLLTPKWKDRITIFRNYGNIPKIQSSHGEIGQVFVNLLANACEAISKEGTVQISTSYVRAKESIEIRIRDSGVGIPKEEIAKIFDPFYTTKPQGEGTGLGLAITLQIVKKHQGTIEVKSEIQKGTEIVVSLVL